MGGCCCPLISLGLISKCTCTAQWAFISGQFSNAWPQGTAGTTSSNVRIAIDGVMIQVPSVAVFTTTSSALIIYAVLVAEVALLVSHAAEVPGAEVAGERWWLAGYRLSWGCPCELGLVCWWALWVGSPWRWLLVVVGVVRQCSGENVWVLNILRLVSNRG